MGISPDFINKKQRNTQINLMPINPIIRLFKNHLLLCKPLLSPLLIWGKNIPSVGQLCKSETKLAAEVAGLSLSWLLFLIAPVSRIQISLSYEDPLEWCNDTICGTVGSVWNGANMTDGYFMPSKSESVQAKTTTPTLPVNCISYIQASLPIMLQLVTRHVPIVAHV